MQCVELYSRNSTHARLNREHFMQNAQDAINGYIGVWDVHGALDNPEAVRIVTAEGRQQIIQRCSESISSKQKIETLVTFLLETGSLEYTLSVLGVVGLSVIADEIHRPLNRQLCRSVLTHSRHLQTLYFRLKENIDNNNFTDKGQCLQDMSQTIKSAFPRFTNDNDLTMATGRLAVVTWLRIQHCNRNTQLIRAVLDDMRDSWPDGVDRSLCEIFYHSKMAVAATMDGDIESALRECRTAKCLNAPFLDPLTSALTSHDSRYTNQRVFMLNKTEENRRMILFESENGLDWLSSDYNGYYLFKRLMKRMFLLYLAQYYLKIENDLSTDENDDISQNDLKNAKNALLCYDKTVEPNEQIYPRLERLYLMYKAKKHVIHGELEKSEETQQYQNEHPDRGVQRKSSDLDIENEMEHLCKQFLPETVIDPRRAMFYIVCQARICEWETKFEKAGFLLNRAFELAQEGAHYINEKKNIINFANRLIIRPLSD